MDVDDDSEGKVQGEAEIAISSLGASLTFSPRSNTKDDDEEAVEVMIDDEEDILVAQTLDDAEDEVYEEEEEEEEEMEIPAYNSMEGDTKNDQWDGEDGEYPLEDDPDDPNYQKQKELIELAVSESDRVGRDRN